MQGCVRALAVPWIARNWATRDWIRSSEVHGMPIRLADVPAMANKEDKGNFVHSLTSIGREAVVGCPVNVDGTKFDVRLLEAHNNSWEVFRGLIDRCDTAITLTLQWQTLTTEVKEGSFAAARVHSDVKQSALEFDDQSLAHDLWQQVARPFAAWNFGDAEKAPWTHHDVEPQEDVNAKALGLQAFATAVASLKQQGIPVDVAELARECGIPFAPGPAVSGESKPQIFGYHLEAGIITINEMRERLGLPAIAGGDALVTATPQGASSP
jgi:phage gp29-like protein